MKEFFDALYGMKAVERRDLLEKDYQLHRLLAEFSQDPSVSDRLIFKGGTCLIKAYLGYFRFSEDLDFTWADQRGWDDMTPSTVKRVCSEHISGFGERLQEICGRLGMEYRYRKNDKAAVEIGGGGRLARFYPSFISQTDNIVVKLKVEVNFLERLLHPVKRMQLKTYLAELRKKDAEVLRFRHPTDYGSYVQKVEFNCYGPEEIFVEKCRAALTRQALKLRDYIDILALEDAYGYTIPKYSNEIAEKTEYMLQLYEKYRKNIRLTAKPRDISIKDEERRLLLKPLPHGIRLAEEIPRINRQLTEIPELKRYIK